MNIIQAESKHIPEVARLFDLYRQFYDCVPDLETATHFISDRVSNNESVIFVAETNDRLCGFVQMYPSFCSVDAAKIFILYDLFVDSAVRNGGVGALLMNQASGFARKNGAIRLDLLTGVNNQAGQHLYEKLGYKRGLDDFYAYSLSVS
ncbi:MAG: ribosomal protein S18 acetylase RimI-like enzyme [Gammaproteobacteria bacterium]|jgi:ribosomal protein S18 acetylase RimI-like enzyme